MSLLQDCVVEMSKYHFHLYAIFKYIWILIQILDFERLFNELTNERSYVKMTFDQNLRH